MECIVGYSLTQKVSLNVGNNKVKYYANTHTQRARTTRRYSKEEPQIAEGLFRNGVVGLLARATSKEMCRYAYPPASTPCGLPHGAQI